jgi:DNA-binding HxlR family transcriptional regulator
MATLRIEEYTYRINIICRNSTINRILQIIEGLTPKVLTQRMKSLQRQEIVERIIVLKSPAHTEYRLTGLGRALEPVLLAAAIYSMGFIPSTVFKDKKPRSFEEFLR